MAHRTTPHGDGRWGFAARAVRQRAPPRVRIPCPTMNHLLIRLVVILVMPATLALAGCQPATIVVGLAPGGSALQATAIERDGRWGSPRIVVVDVSGTLVNGSTGGLLGGGVNPVDQFAHRLDAAAADPKVAAVILRINSPGGTVTASDIMYREVKRYRARTGKPVMALVMDVGASGGYYLACGASEIMAYPTSVTGSIGVILQTLSVRPALDRWGDGGGRLWSAAPIKPVAPPSKRSPKNSRPCCRVWSMISTPASATWSAKPGPGSPPTASTSSPTAASSPAPRPRPKGLVDSLGDIRDAVARARTLAGIDHADLFIYHGPLSSPATPYAQRGTGDVHVSLLDLGELLPPATLNGPCYLWRPGFGAGD